MEQGKAKVDGYVFLRSKNPWPDICALWQSYEVRYPGRLIREKEDDDRIAVFLEGDDDAALKKRMDNVISKANPSYSAAKATAVTINGPTHWSEKKQWGAYVRIKAANPRAVFASLDPTKKGAPISMDNFHGLALCEGDWQVFLEIGADSLRDLGPLAARVEAMPGVTSMIVSKLKNHRQKPNPPQQCPAFDDPY